MAAALRLADAGRRVTLVERRPYLGGRAYSFADPETGVQVDNGQHVFMRCCDAYVDFLRELGTLDLTAMQPRLRVEARSPSGKAGAIAASRLPSPLHLLPSFARYPHLGWREKLRAASALRRIQRDPDPDRDELRAASFGEWLRRNGQSERAVANFWELVALPTLNDRCGDVSASMAFTVFRIALLQDPHAADVGIARAPLSDVMGAAAERALRERGVDVVLGRSVARITTSGGAVAGVVLAGGGEVAAEGCVAALPAWALPDVLPDELRDSALREAAASHTFAPIVNLHVWVDRPVADFTWAAFVDSPLQYVFNRTRIAGLPGPGEHLTVSLSGAWEWWPLTKEALRERFTAELERALPAMRGARVTRFVVVKEQRATFRSPPGGPRNRPPAATALPGLALAGDWTDTGWPATMEGAVRSGNAAAEVIAASA